MESIIQAKQTDSKILFNLVRKTIKQIYPHYYPKGAVKYFLDYHSLQNIQKDILDGNVYILNVENKVIGTITICENEINRFFVLPEYEHKGYGTKLFNYAQELICNNGFTSIILYSSFSAKPMYKKLGFIEKEFELITTSTKDFLAADIMEKQIEENNKHHF